MPSLLWRRNPSTEELMTSIRVDSDAIAWTAGTAFCGPGAIYEGKEIVQVKLLNDRRPDGGGSAWLVKFSPPPGKLIRIVATARSDEHAFGLAGGRSTKAGEPTRNPSGYLLNTEGQPHSAFIAEETIAFVLYTGEVDEVHSLEVVDLEPAAEAAA
jgi:hypothetical protein